MSDPIRLRLVTNRPDEAAISYLGVTAEACPSWCAIVTTPRAVSAIPDGSRCIPQFYLPAEGDGDTAPLTEAWRLRRLEGGVFGLTSEEFEKLRMLRTKRQAGSEAAA